MNEYMKKRYTSKGEIEIKGKTVPYRTTAEDFPVFRTAEKADGTTFTFSYERSDVSTMDGRPVLFAWNGGPGAASLFVHLGLLAPIRVKCGNGIDMNQTAPFEMEVNRNCILDVCDIVVVDAMGTGYTQVADEEAKQYWYTTEHDAEAFVMTIRKWMTAHNRWNSPIYVMGESYGTIRNALVAEGIYLNGTDAALQHLSGVIMLGSALDYGQNEFPVPKSVLNLPSIAAARWYWHREEDMGTLEEFVEECFVFCNSEYLLALNAGKSYPEEKKLEIARKLQRYTGYPIEKLLEDQLQVDIFEYPAKGLRDEGKSIGIYDARFALGKIKDATKYDYFADDASNAIGTPAFMACFHSEVKKALNIEIEEEYKLLDMTTEKCWDFHTKTYPPVSLENAMHRNPKLKLMFGMGIYDMLTTLGWCQYLVNHYDYSKERTEMKYYFAGHMPYLCDEEAMKLQEDIREFIVKEG